MFISAILGDRVEINWKSIAIEAKTATLLNILYLEKTAFGIE